MHVKILQKKALLKKCGPKMCVFVYVSMHIVEKIKRATTIDTFS